MSFKLNNWILFSFLSVTAAARRQLRGETGNKKSPAEIAAEIRKRMESERLESKDEVVQARALWGKVSDGAVAAAAPLSSPLVARRPDADGRDVERIAAVTEPRLVTLVRMSTPEDRTRGTIGVRLQLTSSGQHRISSVVPDGAAAASRRGASPLHHYLKLQNFWDGKEFLTEKPRNYADGESEDRAKTCTDR